MARLPSSQQLIVRLRVEQLVASDEWEAAAELGAEVLRRGPPTAELLRTATCLSKLGMVGGVAARTLAPLLAHGDLREGLVAIKHACADDFDQVLPFVEAACAACSPPQHLALIEGAVALADTHVAPAMLLQPCVAVAIRMAVGDPIESRRGAGLQLIGAFLRLAPASLCARLCPVLTTAALVETDALQALALAILGDVAAVLAQLPTSHEHAGSATEQLASVLRLLSTCLYAPSIELQSVAALAQSKLALIAAGALGTIDCDGPPRAHGTRDRASRGCAARGARGRGRGGGRGGARAKRRRVPDSDVDSSDTEEDQAAVCGVAAAFGAPAAANGVGIYGGGDGVDSDGVADRGGDGADGGGGAYHRREPSGDTILGATLDAEGVLADLAFRYTAQVSQEALPKAAAAPHTALAAKLQACFEALTEARATPFISNTVVWVLLGAAEDGALDTLRVGSDEQQPVADVLEPRTQRCVRYLSSLIVGGMHWESAAARAQVMSDLVEAAALNLQLEHGINVASSSVARWLGVDAAAEPQL
jgi:hypothetical protein